MIGEHVLKWEGGQHVLKLSTRAQMRIEAATGLPFVKAFQSIGESDGFKITRLVELIAPMMHAGKGGTDDEACDLIDTIGLEAAGEAIGEAAEKAFPDMKKGASGNGRKAAKA